MGAVVSRLAAGTGAGGTGGSRQLAIDAALAVFMAVGVGMTYKFAKPHVDPYWAQRRAAKRRADLVMERLGRNLKLDEFEQLLAANVLNPQHIDISIADVGGLEAVKRDMYHRVLRPLREHGVLSAALWRPVKGVLLYGPPGTGKTMLAKAMAREADCFFLNVTASTVLSKWYGDANKFIRAIFTLAHKLQPCIVFIDEVDSFLTKRGGHSEHEQTLSFKTEFMQLWDGIEGVRGNRVLVMGATNRPSCIDEAVLRRFALQYEVPLPGAPQRREILLSHLRRHADECRELAEAGMLARGDGGVHSELFKDSVVDVPGAQPGEGCLSAVVRATEGYSGSDLTELCAQAAQDVLSEKWAADEAAAASAPPPGADPAPALAPAGASAAVIAAAASSAAAAALLFPPRATPLRPVRAADLVAALELVKPSSARAGEYAARPAAPLAAAAAPPAAGGRLEAGAAAAEEAWVMMMARLMAAGAGGKDEVLAAVRQGVVAALTQAPHGPKGAGPSDPATDGP
ncbi:MAG: P-loop containing nucleoside triphosphate hydrolase protein [Monoraphidium minutum]|nr:MAG: P-loop containing nucleoside triphosphate hydrolase protein [Monoraphidium minutum]